MFNDKNKCACTFSIFAENSPGVLHRIIVLFTRRKMNIESLTVSHTETEGISRFTLVVNDTPRNAEKIAAQLRRIIEVLKVQVSQNEELIYKEIAFFRIETPDAHTRQYIAHHVVRLGASIVSIDPEALVIEKTGNEEEIETLFKSFKNVKIKEFIRSGRIAIRKHMSELNNTAETFKVMENQTRIDLQ
ncbi:MAG: acetolactate synthase small subunit [SAR324 cluster bacterium]|uniref:Acetolactate synthase small subunit n=1 Tax=SAR324 cluster bacterium TaxID=2024889 RepID=A0A7X9FT88_9DELT|nr:acetolactate synthase small subunit [SAR324 cluster bacterium]